MNCRLGIKQTGISGLVYADDYDGVYPPSDDTKAVGRNYGRVDSVKSPSKMVIWMESYYFSRGWNRCYPRHSGGLNVLYIDGHARWAKRNGQLIPRNVDEFGYYPFE